MSLTSRQLRQLRERYYAFLRLDRAEQAALLAAAPEFDKLTDAQRKAYQQRAAWLRKVIKSLTDEQRAELKKMAPAERARRLLELKAKLARSEPTSQPATATAPAE